MRLRDLFRRSAAPEAAAVANGNNGSNGAAQSTTPATLPPWGGQWPWAWGTAAAENVATVLSCVEVISSAIAALPALVYEILPDGSRREAPGHPVQRLVAAPNDLDSWPDLVRWFMGQVLLFGNALLVIDRDGAGQPRSLFPVPWGTAAQPILVPRDGGGLPTMPNSRLAFDIVQTFYPWPYSGAANAAGFPRRYWADNGEVFYLRERSSNGYLGVSRLARAPLVLGGALAVQEFATYLWNNAATPNLALSHPGRLSAEAVNNLSASWRENFAGPQAARKTLVLEEGMSVKELSATAEDSEVLDSRRFAAEEIARIYGVPPPLAGIWQYSSFTNSQQASIWFASNTLAPWAAAISAEFSRSVFVDPSRFCLELDLSQMLKGDFQTRAQVLVGLLRAGAITQNELRHELSYSPIEGGDRLVMQAAGGDPMGGRPSAADGAAGTDSPRATNGSGGRPNGTLQ